MISSACRKLPVESPASTLRKKRIGKDQYMIGRSFGGYSSNPEEPQPARIERIRLGR